MTKIEFQVLDIYYISREIVQNCDVHVTIVPVFLILMFESKSFPHYLCVVKDLTPLPLVRK